MRTKALPLLVAVLLLAASAVPVASARATKPKPSIKGEEVGYFGSATVTHHIAVFVYLNLSPRSGVRVSVCVAGRCKRALGHNRPAPWYSASFTTHGMRMGDPVNLKVLAANSSGTAKLTVTRDLLCMHNNGSTPQN